MGGSHVDPGLRRRVRARARRRCEYCGFPDALSSGAFHCDHFLPASAGGATTADNLVWGCPSCNAFKHKRTSAIDPVTRRRTPLFNPRVDAWPAHFRWSPNALRIQGTTAVGRATVVALKLNRPHARRVRAFLLQLGLHPALG